MVNKHEEITKAEFARALDVSRAWVTRLSHRGLPVLPSGRLNLAAALAWVAKNSNSFSGGWPSRGRTDMASRAFALLNGQPPDQPGQRPARAERSTSNGGQQAHHRCRAGAEQVAIEKLLDVIRYRAGIFLPVLARHLELSPAVIFAATDLFDAILAGLAAESLQYEWPALGSAEDGLATADAGVEAEADRLLEEIWQFFEIAWADLAGQSGATAAGGETA